MRIVVLSFFTDLVERGVEVYAQNLVKSFSSKHDFKLITSQDLSVKITPYTGQENPWWRRFYLDQTSRQICQATKTVLFGLEATPPDILYPLNNGWQSLLAKQFCLKHRTKLILAGHSGLGWDDRVNLWLKPDVFIAFSAAQKNWAQRVNRRVKCVKINHGVDLTKFNPQIKPISLKLEKPIFVTISALSRQSRGGETRKRVGQTIRAVGQLSQGSLLLLGKGKDQTRIDKLGQTILGPKRYRRLSVSHNIIAKYLTAADVFTLTSSSEEAFGLAYLEALACNLPVVATDDPIRREIIGPAGIFIQDPLNLDEYARGLNQAAKTSWGNKPYQQAQKFSLSYMMQQYNQLFHRL
jgi:glycosyltransferase involved in cell wall biosynthesis